MQHLQACTLLAGSGLVCSQDFAASSFQSHRLAVVKQTQAVLASAPPPLSFCSSVRLLPALRGDEPGPPAAPGAPRGCTRGVHAGCSTAAWHPGTPAAQRTLCRHPPVQQLGILGDLQRNTTCAASADRAWCLMLPQEYSSRSYGHEQPSEWQTQLSHQTGRHRKGFIQKVEAAAVILRAMHQARSEHASRWLAAAGAGQRGKQGSACLACVRLCASASSRAQFSPQA